MIYHPNQETVHKRSCSENLKIHTYTLKPVLPLHWKDARPYFGAGKQTGVFHIPDTPGQDRDVTVSQKRAGWWLVGQPHHCSTTTPLLVLCLLSPQLQEDFVRQFFRTAFHNWWRLWVTGKDM